MQTPRIDAVVTNPGRRIISLGIEAIGELMTSEYEAGEYERNSPSSKPSLMQGPLLEPHLKKVENLP